MLQRVAEKLDYMTEPIDRLSGEQIQHYHEQGYLSVEAITTSEEVGELIGLYDELFVSGAGAEDGYQFDLTSSDKTGEERDLPQVIFPSKYQPRFLETRLFSTASTVATQLLGENAEFFFDHAIFKPARHGAPTPWHQDEAYHDPAFEHQTLDIWVPLQDVDERNGCMHFVPGSHRSEITPHQPVGGDPLIRALEAVGFDPDQHEIVSCPLAAGGATVHDFRTLHYTPPNRSDRPRRAYIMAFALPKVPRKVRRRFPWREEQNAAHRAQESTENHLP